MNRTPRTHHRFWAMGSAVLLIAGLGFAFSLAPPLYHVPKVVEAPRAAQPEALSKVPAEAPLAEDTHPRRNPAGHVREQRAAELKVRFEEAVVMLHARQYEYAVASLHRVLELSPRMPEAHVNMGYALLGLNNPRAARDFFVGAIELNPNQVNAYYGLAVSQEGLGALPEALGAMRTYLHLAPADTQYGNKARAALWEWEARMKQKPQAQAVNNE